MISLDLWLYNVLKDQEVSAIRAGSAVQATSAIHANSAICEVYQMGFLSPLFPAPPIYTRSALFAVPSI